MNHRAYVAVLGLVILCCCSCQTIKDNQKKQEMKQMGKKFLAQLESPSEADKEKFGLSEFRLLGNWQHAKDATLQGDDPETWEVVLPVWVEGTDKAGNGVKRQPLLTMTLVKEQGRAWHMRGYTLTDDRPLSFWHQALHWLALSYGVPILVTVWVLAFFNNEKARAAIAVIAPLCALVSAGVFAYHCFGSVLAVVGCLIVFALSCVVLVGSMAQSKESGAGIGCVFSLAMVAILGLDYYFIVR